VRRDPPAAAFCHRDARTRRIREDGIRQVSVAKRDAGGGGSSQENRGKRRTGLRTALRPFRAPGSRLARSFFSTSQRPCVFASEWRRDPLALWTDWGSPARRQVRRSAPAKRLSGLHGAAAFAAQKPRNPGYCSPSRRWAGLVCAAGGRDCPASLALSGCLCVEPFGFFQGVLQRLKRSLAGGQSLRVADISGHFGIDVLNAEHLIGGQSHRGL